MSDGRKIHIKWRCPVCKTVIDDEAKYPANEYSQVYEEEMTQRFVHTMGKHMADIHGNVRLQSPYEKCHGCGEMHLWERMHMFNDEVYCNKCYNAI